MRIVPLILIGLFMVSAAPTAPGAQEVRGFMTTQGVTTQGVTGQDVAPHGWKEESVYLAPMFDGAASVGAHTMGSPQGWFGLRGDGPLPGGAYAFFTLKYDGIPAFDIARGVTVPEGDEMLDHQSFATDAHYSVMYNTDSADWSDAPWVWGGDFYQTFIATTPHVTRIATRLADKSGSYQELYLNYAVYATNDGPPSSWELISPVRTRFLSATTDPIIHIFGVVFRSSEVTLVPGERYAVRLWRDERSQSETFALVARPNNEGDGYAGGHLYLGDETLPDWDAFGYVSGGAAGTLVNHAPVEDFNLNSLLGWNSRFGQTFRATGNALAAVEVVFSRIHGTPHDIPVTFQLYDAPGGEAIGPAKVGRGVPGPFQGRAAALWQPDEAPLEPGKIYYIEGASEGLNVWGMNQKMPDTAAYLEDVKHATADLLLSVAEYAAP